MFGDAKVFAKSQAAYLWLYDRTGIYVGTIGMTTIVAADALTVLHHGKLGPIVFVNLTIIGFLCGFRYHIQNSEKYEVFNAIARHWHEARWRPVLGFIWIALMFDDLIHQRWLLVAACILNFCFFGYVLCWQIRKREPPEKLVFAPQGSN